MNNDTQTTTLEPAPSTSSEQATEVNPFAEQAAQEAAKPKKPGILSQVTTRKRRRPVFAVVYGPPGIGKSTFGTNAPNPIFLQVERGLDQITVPKLPIPKDFSQLYAQVDALDREEHGYQSIVLDTLDATEILIWQRARTEGKVTSIEDYGGGYGKGYVRAREIWTGLLSKLNEMSERFNVILLAHSHLKTVNDPMQSAAYDMHRIKIHDKSAEIIRQMVDLICFANLDVSIIKESQKARKGRGIISEDRLMWTAPTTGIEAKNRYDLDNPMPFSWAALEKGVNDFYDR
ncbi:MAG TPA: ATP-binding protein [Chthoniobacterales bacterium]|nr:ATP-binding protein [Chthoniobacterales bacterium]